MLRNIKYYWKSILWILLILYLSAGKFVFMSTVPPQIEADKVGHFVMYFILSAIFFNDYTRQKKDRKLLTLFIGTFIFPLLFGGLMELLQHFFIPYRTGSWMDMLANLTGIITAFLLSYFFFHRKNNSSALK